MRQGGPGRHSYGLGDGGDGVGFDIRTAFETKTFPHSQYAQAEAILLMLLAFKENSVKGEIFR
jgi:hypothetical protein